MSLLTAVRDRNSLNAIRLILASTVLVAHSGPLAGAAPPDGSSWAWPGQLAVAGFFAISGYLVADSRTRLSAVRFVWHRIMRLYPAYAVMLVVVSFLFAPAVSLAAGEHWTWRAGAHYLVANWWLEQGSPGIPGTLFHVPVVDVWNGSAWTLYFEALCYLVVGAVLTFTRSPWVAGLGLAGAIAGNVRGINDFRLWGMFHLGAPFAAGTLLFLLGDRVPIRRDLAAVSAAVVAAAVPSGQVYTVGALPLAYLVLWAGVTWRTEAARRTDISYGVYIYAFPVQQALADLGIAVVSVWTFIAATAAITFPLAFASWHLVERRALRLKRWSPPPTLLRAMVTSGRQ